MRGAIRTGIVIPRRSYLLMVSMLQSQRSLSVCLLISVSSLGGIVPICPRLSGQFGSQGRKRSHFGKTLTHADLKGVTKLASLLLALLRSSVGPPKSPPLEKVSYRPAFLLRIGSNTPSFVTICLINNFLNGRRVHIPLAGNE
jgi:hypothetical protein